MPAVSLGASAKRNIDAALVDMNEWSFVGWQELPPPYDEFTAIFLDEAEEILENTQSLLERWQATPDNLPLMRELQRELHTLKGSARIVGISAMADLSHSLESVLNRIVEGGVQSNSKLQEIVQNSVDELAALLEAVRAGVPLDMPTDLIALINTSLTVGGEGRRELEAERAYCYRQEMEETTAMPPESYAMPPPAVTSAPPAAVTSKPAPPQTRTEFPEMLFYGLVPVTGTTHDLVLPVGEALTTWVVETFALRHGDWAQARTTVVVDQPVRLDLEVPPAVYPQDNVVGRIHVVTASGLARLRLHCDGQPVELRSGKLTWCNPDSIVTPAELEFSVTPGHYQATVEDLHTHDTDSIETTVQEPTKVKSYRKALHLLQSGENLQTTPSPSLLRRGETTQQIPLLDKEGLGVVSLRLLPTLDTPFNALITATADYGHLCCEQTAAKILAATFMYLTASEDSPRRQAEQIIITGIAREHKMFRPGRGFAMYPDGDYFSEHYSKYAVFYLWRLQPLEALPDLSSTLRQAVQEGLEMANQVAVVHQLQRIPDRIIRIEDAYTLATLQKMPETIYRFIDTLIEFTGTEARLRKPNHQVADRTLLAYAAASLIALKSWQRGLRLANQVTRQFNAQGGLYSTVDSAAALALLQQLKLANVAMGTGQLLVNSKVMTLEEAFTLAEPVTSVEVVEGVTAVEVTYLHTEDWEFFGQPFPITVDFRETDSAGKQKKRFALGNRLTLHIALPQGYRLGDIAHVVLPPCLSAIEGGAKVKRFTLDFAGHNQLRIPLLVTSKLQGVQHFAVCVRNMFEEERASSTGLLTVTSEPRDSESR
jgi:HPt (histidine-containing phosphotransfer) domain-containing protein